MFEYLFLDLDDTILDFGKAESAAIEKTLLFAGIAPTPENKSLYSRINKSLWEALERGEVTRETLKVLRFRQLFEALGVDADPREASEEYVRLLGIGHYFLPGAEEAVESLSKKYRLFLASNGNASVQKGRMTSANLYRFFEKVFVSEEIGANKPSAEYFERSFAQIPGFDKSKAIIVGDSLSSDIRGGNNAGIATCWVNPKGLPRREGIRVDYEIKALSELPALLEAL